MDHDPQENQDPEVAQFTATLEKSTLPSDVDVGVHGSYRSRDEARKVADATLIFFRLFGTVLNLDGIEAVTIADDYAGALARVERGFETSCALTASSDEFGNGLAMAVPVLRNGELKTHIVLHSNLPRVLALPENEMFAVVVHTLAHEAAHAHDHAIESRSFPGLYGTRVADYKQGRLFLLAHMCWNEYIASHLSSRWGTKDYCEDYSKMLCSMLSSARDRGNAALNRHREHRDIMKAESELVDAYGTLLVRASYLVGHIHGLGKTVEEMAPEFLKLVNETLWFRPIFEQYELNVKTLYESYGEWPGIEVFEPLKRTFEIVLNAGGMFYVKLPNGTYYVGLNRPTL